MSTTARISLTLALASSLANPANAGWAPPSAVVSVSNAAALASYPSHSTGVMVRTRGFYSPGDGGGAFYTYSAAACAYPDGGFQIPATGGGCWELDLSGLGGRLDVRIWGAKLDGTTDDRAPIQAAIAVAQRVGGSVFIPGRASISSAVVVTAGNVVIEGQDRATSGIHSTSPTDDIIRYYDSTPLGPYPFRATGFFYGTVRRLTLDKIGVTGQSAGHALYLNNVQDILYEDLLIKNTYRGVGMVDVGLTRCKRVDVSRVSQDAFYVDGGPVHDFDHCTSYSDDTAPAVSTFRLRSSGGVHIVNSGSSASSNAVLVDPPTGKAVFDIFTSGNDFDDSRDWGIQLTSLNGGTIDRWQSSNDRIGFSVRGGLIIKENGGTGAVRNIMLSNMQLERNRQEGLRFEGGQYVTVNGGQIIGNDVGNDLGGGPYPSITVAGGNFISLNGVFIGPANGLPLNTNFGIVFESTFVGTAMLMGNVFTGQVQGSPVLNNAGSGAVVRIGPNVGISPW